MLIGYARVSTVDQNLSVQRDALTEAGCEHIYTEQLSGAVIDRPALKALLQFARKGDTLIVWKLDRLARSVKQLIETVEDLRVRGIGFRSLTESIDTTTAQGLLIFHIFSALAEFERSLIRERTHAGLAAARRSGRTGGRRRKLSADDIEAAKSLLANPDIGVTQIARRLGVSPATLYRHIPAARTMVTGKPVLCYKTDMEPVYSDHIRLDERSLALHRLIARKLAADPDLLDKARDNLRRWQESSDSPSLAFAEWAQILTSPVDQVEQLLTERSERATRLRQSSPFCGILTEAERRVIYESYSTRTYHPRREPNIR